jgi:outer membrane protein OmpU
MHQARAVSKPGHRSDCKRRRKDGKSAHPLPGFPWEEPTFERKREMMKKILLATSILAGTVAVASAEVSLSGNARFGIKYNGTTSTLEKRMTVNVDGSGESDAGISYGGRIRLRSDENSTGMSGARVFITAGGLTVAAGNINGAIDSMPNMYATGVGLQGLGDHGVVVNVGTGSSDASYWNFDSFSSKGNGAEGIEVIYSAGAFGAHLSHSDGVTNGFSATGNGVRRTAAFVSYAFDGDWTVALGGQVGNFDVSLAAADNNKKMKYALSGATTFGATTVKAFVAKEDALTTTLWGLGVSHDLGGITVQGGVASNRAGSTIADLGVSFSF